MERSGVLPTTQFAYRKGLGTCGPLLCLPNTMQNELESRQEVRIVQIDFSQTYKLRISNTLCSVGIGDSALSILRELLPNIIIVARYGWRLSE